MTTNAMSNTKLDIATQILAGMVANPCITKQDNIRGWAAEVTRVELVEYAVSLAEMLERACPEIVKMSANKPDIPNC